MASKKRSAADEGFVVVTSPKKKKHKLGLFDNYRLEIKH
jgi:hypothetical protein